LLLYRVINSSLWLSEFYRCLWDVWFFRH